MITSCKGKGRPDDAKRKKAEQIIENVSES